MRLTSRDGSTLAIRPVAYQFAEETSGWDANWLDIRGDVAPTGETSWTFTDPCLTTWEARSFSDWLHDVVTGPVSSSCEFTEPNLAFSVREQTADRVLIRVDLSLEALPPGRTGVHPVLLDLSLDALAAAATEWDGDCRLFPER